MLLTTSFFYMICYFYLSISFAFKIEFVLLFLFRDCFFYTWIPPCFLLRLDIILVSVAHYISDFYQYIFLFHNISFLDLTLLILFFRFIYPLVFGSAREPLHLLAYKHFMNIVAIAVSLLITSGRCLYVVFIHLY